MALARLALDMYVCPVCSDRQADLEHLADHLAITASLDDEAHERWLDAHAADWPDLDRAALADRLDAVCDPVEPTAGPEGGDDAANARAAFRDGVDAADDE